MIGFCAIAAACFGAAMAAYWLRTVVDERRAESA